MNEKQINKWLRKRFSPVGWTLVGYYVLMNILVSVAMLRDVIAGYLNAFIEGNDQYVPDVSALTGNAWGYIAAVAVALVILYAWKGREFWGGEVLRREKPMKPGTLLCMVCLCAGTQMVNFVWIVCTHIDKAHIHNHVIWNSTTLDEQSKFRNFWGSTKAVRRLNDTICVENGYSIVENPKGKSKTYDKWLGDQKKPSHRERICYAIDDAIEQKPQSFEKLLELLRESGYQIKGGKVPSLLGKGQKRFIRMDTLGAGYTPDNLRAIIDGTKAHTPKKKRVMDTQTIPSGSLLIDIQAKLQEGKGAGYARWAKNFNLKQLSQTLIYLEENNLLDRIVLEERTTAVTAQYHTLSAKMKSAEQRMAEIKVLQQHIINYAKTRNTYVAYRKAGYSKRFLLEHESEIILHKAAKQFFDEQGLKKLPTVKSLQAEYAQLLSEKKAMYADYQKAREDMRALQTAKANVDRILGDNSLTEEIETEKNR